MRKLAALVLLVISAPLTGNNDGLIDDFNDESSSSRLGTDWRLVTDRVMGGVSDARMQRRSVDGQRALCLSGAVSLENNGGFVQINLDLSRSGLLDASAFDGVRLVARGNDAEYNVHLKTPATRLPWQSYRATMTAGPAWQEHRLPFASFHPHRLVPALDPARLKRLGIVAIGRAMSADICIAEIGFYQDPPAQ
ncbi:CIA30 family protein [Halochromatium glycolicum]|uniref:NADH:ubiquinone oxidoreductase n=1 Tax=Halochromatium glycolicum TaxID=85075 RepID=A0AAJ0U5R8_9GAMM|nr:CIA30 family protein [Halochromatium glycolicum]MBK1705789.1 NADH:ubiquinone oxidoreductase [Halochromatium glycolicum]